MTATRRARARTRSGAPSYFPGYYRRSSTRAYVSEVAWSTTSATAASLDDLTIWPRQIGDLNAGLLFPVDSGTAYSIRANNRPLTSIQNAILA